MLRSKHIDEFAFIITIITPLWNQMGIKSNNLNAHHKTVSSTLGILKSLLLSPILKTKRKAMIVAFICQEVVQQHFIQ